LKDAMDDGSFTCTLVGVIALALMLGTVVASERERVAPIERASVSRSALARRHPFARTGGCGRIDADAARSVDRPHDATDGVVAPAAPRYHGECPANDGRTFDEVRRERLANMPHHKRVRFKGVANGS